MTKKKTKTKVTKIKAKKHIPEEYPHFRYYMRSKHPALIVGEQSTDEYRFRKVTHSVSDGKRNNEKVYPNPNPQDKKPMYIGKRVRHDKKINFGKKYPWVYKKNK